LGVPVWVCVAASSGGMFAR